ncbi:MAG: OmpA family protein [Acidobacteria bacterium]|nr:OmpA family protein [Acidobacteriota bacterium]MCH8985062.1 OmpA family protein [Acidobacteriota bacterium]
MSRRVNKRLQELNTRGSSRPGQPVVDDTPLAWLPFIAASMTGLLVLVLVAAWFGGKSVEDSIESTLAEQFLEAGLKNISVTADGRAVTVSGAVDNEADVAVVVEIAKRHRLSRTVSFEDIRIVVPAGEGGDVSVEPVPFVVQWVGSEATVTGTMSDESALASVLVTVDSVFATVDSSDLVVLTGVPSESEWLGAALRMLTEIGTRLDVGSVTVNRDVIAVSGEFEDRQTRRDARDVAESIVEDSVLDFVSGLTVKEEPPPVKQQVVELQTTLDDLIAGKVVEFELNSDVLTDVGIALLDEILDALRQFPLVPVEISGYADSQGEAEANLDLSLRRAQSVLDYLVAAGVDPKLFEVVGYGETQPIADNATAEGRKRNRRIEFKALEV